MAVVCLAVTAQAQETWAPVVMFDGRTITVNGGAPITIAPSIDAGAPEFLDAGGNPVLIAFPNGIGEDAARAEWIVADTFHSRLLRFASDHHPTGAAGAFLGEISTALEGDVHASWPYSPVVDDAGVILVPDHPNSSIKAFVPSGGGYIGYRIASYRDGGVEKFFGRPRRIIVLPDVNGERDLQAGKGVVIVLDSVRKKVFRLAPDDVTSPQWTVVSSFGEDATETGPGPGNFYSPTGLGVDSAGNIYVSDPEGDVISIQVFSPAGVPLQTIAQGLSAPWSLTIAPDDRLFVADTDNNRIAVFSKYDGANPTASLVPVSTRIGSPSLPLGGSANLPDGPNLAGGVGVLQAPTDVQFDQFGRLLVADTDDFRIQVFDRARLTVTALAVPQTVTVADDHVDIRVIISNPDADSPVAGVLPAIPDASVAVAGGAGDPVVTEPPACVVTPQSAPNCVALDQMTSDVLPGGAQTAYTFRFARITTPAEAVGPVWFSAHATGSAPDAANPGSFVAVVSGNAETYAVAVRGDQFAPPSVTANLDNPANGSASNGWYRTQPVVVDIAASVAGPGDGDVLEIENAFGPPLINGVLPPAPVERDYVVCFNRFTAIDPATPACSLPIFKEGTTTVWYRAVSTNGLYDHLTPSAIDPSVNVPGWNAILVSLDVTSPTIDASSAAADVSLTNGWWRSSTGGPVTVTVEAADQGSLLASFSVDGTSVAIPAAGVRNASVTKAFTGDGQHSIELSATDRAGNGTSDTGTFRIDSTPPLLDGAPVVTSATTTYTIDTTTWSASPMTVTFSATDPGTAASASGFDATVVHSGDCVAMIDAGNPLHVLIERTFASGVGHTVNCRFSDLAGNPHPTGVAAGLFSLDTAPPTVSWNTYVDGVETAGVSAGGTWWFRAPVEVRFTAQDAGAGFSAVSHQPVDTESVVVSSTVPADVVSRRFTDVLGHWASSNAGRYAVDNEPPVITASNLVHASTAATGIVSFSPANLDVIDNVDVAPELTCVPASGSAFPVGATTVTCTARDDLGNVSTGSFTVTVNDIGSPTLTVPADIVVPAAPVSAVVTYAPVATDSADPSPAVTCHPASGSTFEFIQPVGAPQTVVCIARDSAGNESLKRSFTVTVVDRTGPSFAAPNIVARANPTTADVTFTELVVSDNLDPAPVVTCTPQSGSTFVLGTTSVHCDAVDRSGNRSSTSFTVGVRAETPPAIVGAVNLVAEATNPNGAAVAFNVTATDLLDGTVPVGCAPASGSTFPLGVTVVNCHAENSAGLGSTAAFTVTVLPSAPVCAKAAPSIGELWPPNHRLVALRINGVTNADGSPITHQITSIFQDEPTNGLGDGDTPIDGFGAGGTTARIRAERSGKGNGRVYYIGFTATTAGGHCSATVNASVPHDQRKKGAAVADGPLYDSTIVTP